MTTDGLFDFRVVHIPAKYGKTIRIIPIGDVHYNNPAFARDKWDTDRAQWAKYCRFKDTYFIMTGDIFEAMSTTEREHYVNPKGFHDSNKSRWATAYAKEINDFASEVPFLEEMTLGVFGGNHFFSFFDGTTSDMALASKIKAPYIGSSGYLVLVLEIDKHHSHVIKIFVHHGKGSGKRAGSSFNAVEDAAGYFSDADIVLMGHDHKAGAMTLPALKCDTGKGGRWRIKAFDRVIARTGSYLKSFEAGTKSYAHDAMYRPSTLGGLELLITPQRTQRVVNGKRDDVVSVNIRAVV